MKPANILRTESERIFGTVGYRLGCNAFEFVCETHLELPSQPPPGRSTLVLFAHFDLEGIVDPYVAYYLKALHGLGATIVLANDSVFGPLFPIEEMWNSFSDADMYGAIENTQIATHLQSFFLAWDLNSRTRPFLDAFWNDFQYVVHKSALIWRYEIGLSNHARKAGLSVRPFVSAATIMRTYGRSAAHPSPGRRSGRNNGTLYFWDGLIEDFRFPFLKTIVPRHNKQWHDSTAHLREFIERHTSYPYTLIESNVERIGGGVPLLGRPPRYPPG